MKCVHVFKIKNKGSASCKSKTNKVHKCLKVVASSDSEESSDITDNKTCCVCKPFRPKEQQICVSFLFTSWTQCDF
jgi:hypothetical protein